MLVELSHWDFIGINVLNLRENPFPDYDTRFNKTKIITETDSALSTLKQLKLKVQERLSIRIREEEEVDLGNPLFILVNEPAIFYSNINEDGFKNIIEYIKHKGDSVNIFYRESYSLIPITDLKAPELGASTTNKIKYGK